MEGDIWGQVGLGTLCLGFSTSAARGRLRDIRRQGLDNTEGQEDAEMLPRRRGGRAEVAEHAPPWRRGVLLSCIHTEEASLRNASVTKRTPC